MRITESQLRRIINEEVGRKILSEQKTPEQLAAEAKNVKKVGNVLTWNDDTYDYSADVAKGIMMTAKRGQPLKVVQKGGKYAEAWTSINSTAAQLNASSGGSVAPGGGGQLPGCNLPSLQASLGQKLTSIAKITTGVEFFVQITVADAMPIQPADLITAGQTLAGMGDQTQGGWLKQLVAQGLDTLAGPFNEFAGGLLVFLGTWSQGVGDAKRAFIGGPAGVKCSYKAYAAAIAAAYSNAVSQHFAAIASGFSSIGNQIAMFMKLIVGILTAVGGAVAAAAGLLASAIIGLLKLGLAGIKMLGTLLQQAIIAAGDALIATGTAMKNAVSESIKRRNLDRLALEICSISYARDILRENVSAQNRPLVLL